MLLACNPPPQGVRKIIAASKFQAAKWIKDAATGEIWYWPAEASTHADMARQLSIAEYSKGIATAQ